MLAILLSLTPAVAGPVPMFGGGAVPMFRGASASTVGQAPVGRRFAAAGWGPFVGVTPSTRAPATPGLQPTPVPVRPTPTAWQLRPTEIERAGSLVPVSELESALHPWPTTSLHEELREEP